MSKGIIPHFRMAWNAFKSHPRVFVISMLILFASWGALELAVVAFYRFGFVVWLVLHFAFFLVFSGLMVGLDGIALQAVDGKTPELTGLTTLMVRGPTFLLAFGIYSVAVVGGFVLLIVPGIYVAVRYAFFGQVFATRSTSAFEALRDAAAISSGHWWTVCSLFLVNLALNLAGAAFLGLGLLITFPLSLLATSNLYRSLQRSTL
jgi:uncharacterized membrane protein